MASQTACRRLVIFDFDHTLINCNSDEHIFPVLTGGKAMPMTYSGGSWLTHMNCVFDHLHESHSIKPDDIVKSLATIPFVPGIPSLIQQLASKPDHRLMILSDANKVFIEKALEANNLKQYFTSIMTNHAEFDENGKLRVAAVNEQASRATSGSCPTQECPENLCKGSEIGKILGEFSDHDPEIWYVGDGWNDWCAAVRLPSDRHHVFARTGYTLHSVITKHLKASAKNKQENPLLKCNASFWHDGHELIKCMTGLDSGLKIDES